MTADWMDGGVAANDRDEALSAARHAEQHDLPHPAACRCLPCATNESGLQPGTYGADQ